MRKSLFEGWKLKNESQMSVHLITTGSSDKSTSLYTGEKQCQLDEDATFFPVLFSSGLQCREILQHPAALENEGDDTPPQVWLCEGYGTEIDMCLVEKNQVAVGYVNGTVPSQFLSMHN